MKISLNWLKKYVKIPESVSNEELVRLIGARLVEVEGVIDERTKYNNVYVVRVETCEKIPNTHLTLCQINVGGDSGLVQVVCGAPNVHEGMLAVWIAPGAIVPASVHEDAPFVIGKRKMQGYESCGMLAGADELDFGDDHSGIVEIEPETANPGDMLADVFDLKDLILDIENKSLTHRPDCFGIIGFAREVAGILGQKFEEPAFLFEEDVFPRKFLIFTKNEVKRKESDLKIEVEDSKICPRYTGATLKVIDAVAEDKYLSEMKILIAKSGMTPNSRIVDVTNYMMLLTGQPLHAFDYDKFLAVNGDKKVEIKVRLARNGERLVLLDDTEIELGENDIVICSGDIPVALAGAMGGKSTMIDENTKNVLLEAASFSLFHLRKTQMMHGIFSEAITRFTKGVPAGGTFNVLAEAIKVMNAKPIDLYDKYLDDGNRKPVKVAIEEINLLLGTNYDKDTIVRTLENVSLEVKARGKELEIIAPYWRTDIHIKEDIIEEIGRLLGYDNIEPTLPLHGTAEKNEMWELKRQVRDILAKFGANEVLTYSFVSERLLKKVGQDSKNSYKIVNSISPELQYVRQSLIPSLLEKTYLNEKLPVEEFAIFEMNKVYRKAWGMDVEGVPLEKMQLGFVVAERKGKGTAFYKAKLYVAKLLESLNIKAEFLPIRSETAESKPFETKRTAEIIINGEYAGIVGEFKNSVKHEFKLADYLAGFEINMDLVATQASYSTEIKFGIKKKEDVTVTTDKTYEEILRELQDKYPEAVITPGVIYQAPGQHTRNMTFHIAHQG